MIITVLWEDQLGGQTRGFGPHELLLSSVADELSNSPMEQPRHRAKLVKQVVGHPKNGNGNILRALKEELRRFHGPVIAVIDRDKAHRIWRDAQAAPANCMQGISRQFRIKAPGDYDLIFLINHTEDLLNATLIALGRPILADKPGPDDRDLILNPAVWGSRDVRSTIRGHSPSFDRIVKRVAAHSARLVSR